MNRLALLLFLAIPSHALCMNFDDLFANGNDPFAGMFKDGGDGGFGDFGDLFGGQDDPFAGLFGGGDADPFGPPASPSAGSTKSDKKEEKIKKVKNADEAFKTALPEGTKKLPKKYKEGLEKYLQLLSENLHNLNSRLSGFSLGISTREKLQKQVAIVSRISEMADQIRTQSIYHQALYSKEFNSLRNRIMNSKKEFSKTLDALIDLEEPDSLEVLSARDRRKQDGAVRKAESLVNRTIKPLEKDLKKVIDHAVSKKRLDEKKKKYSEREKQAMSRRSSSAFGGWSGGAGGYFGDSFGGGFGGGGWDFGMGGGGGWDNLFGGGGFGGGGWGGGGGGWGNSFGGWGGSGGGSWGGSSGTRSSSGGGSSSGTILGGSSGSSDNTSTYSDSSSKDSTDKNAPSYIDREPSEELPLHERLPQLARKMKNHLEKRIATYKEAGDREKALRNMLAERSFLADVNRMTTIAQLQAELAADSSEQTDEIAESVAAYEKVAINAVPLLIDAAKYAQKPLERLQEEQEMMQASKVSKAQAERKAAAAQRVRKDSYNALIKWLYVIRKTDRKTIKAEVVSRLQKQAAVVLEKLSTLIKKNDNNDYIAYQDSEQLVMLSQQLLQEPVVIGYSSIPDETPDATDKRKKQFSKLIEQKQEVESGMKELLEKKNDMLINMRTTLQTALGKVRETVDSKTVTLTDPTAMSALNRHLEDVLKTEFSEHPAYAAMKKNMIPYTDDFFKQLEVQVVLHEQLTQAWQQKQPEDETNDVLTDSEVANEIGELADELPVQEQVSQDTASSPISSEPQGQLLSTDDLLALSPQSDNQEEEGLLASAKNLLADNLIAAKAVQGASSFAQDLAKGVVQDTKQNLRRGASQAMQGAITAGVNHMTR